MTEALVTLFQSLVDQQRVKKCRGRFLFPKMIVPGSSCRFHHFLRARIKTHECYHPRSCFFALVISVDRCGKGCRHGCPLVSHRLKSVRLSSSTLEVPFDGRWPVDFCSPTVINISYPLRSPSFPNWLILGYFPVSQSGGHLAFAQSGRLAVLLRLQQKNHYFFNTRAVLLIGFDQMVIL
jgi:hypothetical protein